MRTSQHHLPPPLRSAEVQAALVRASQEAYEITQERHDPDVGDDSMTFGVHIWKTLAHVLLRVVPTVGGCAAVQNQSLVVRFDDVELRHHKLGDRENDSPWTSFPDHTGPASRMLGRSVGIQLDLPLGEVDAEDGPPRAYLDWVLGTYGNADDGLRAVRLQAVGSHRAGDGTIRHWEAVITLYDAAAGIGLPSAPAMATAPALDVEIAPEPDVELRVDVAVRRDAAQP